MFVLFHILWTSLLYSVDTDLYTQTIVLILFFNSVADYRNLYSVMNIHNITIYEVIISVSTKVHCSLVHVCTYKLYVVF